MNRSRHPLQIACALALLLVATAAFPGTDNSRWSGAVGIGTIDTDRFPGSSDRRQRVVPVIDLRWEERYYFRFTRFGAWLWHGEIAGGELRVGPAVRPRFRLRPPPDLPEADREERDFSLDGGLRGEWRGRWFTLSTAAYGDLFGRHRGSAASLEVSSFVPLGGRLRLLPGIGVDWESARIGRFYYGTTAEPDPGAAWIPGASMLVQAPLSERWVVTAGLFASRQPSSRADTGMLDSRTSRTLLFGLGYRL